MESFDGEKELEYDYNCSRELGSGSKEIDLSLKLSQCGEKPEEERKLKMSSSLPSKADEKGLVWFGDLRRAQDCSYNTIPYIAPQLSKEGLLNCNIQKSSSTQQENHDSIVNSSNKITIPHVASASVANAKIGSERFKLGNYCTLKGDVMERLRQMPSVRTTGDGQNGKRIEGILYKYRDGEVCIVCVCHGNFFTPKEFIVHAGGKQVANPMKHITVYTKNPF